MPTSGRNRLLSVSVIGTAVAVATTMTVTSSMDSPVKGMADWKSQVVGPTSDVPSDEPQTEPRDTPGSSSPNSEGESTPSSPPTSESSPGIGPKEKSSSNPDDDPSSEPDPDPDPDPGPEPLPDEPDCADSAAAVSDAFVRDGEHRAKNFGDSQLEVHHADEGRNRMAFVKFDVSKLCDDFSNANLTVTGFVADEAVEASDIGVHGAPNEWDENGVTWDNKPGLDSQLGSFTVTGSDPGEYSVDVTQYLESAEGDEVTIALYAPDGARNEATVFDDRAAPQPPALTVTE